MKNVTVVAIVALLCASALYALTYVSASGHVRSKTPTTLKIQRLDGSKVNASCLDSDAIRHQCDIATPGDPAEGLAECSGGRCSWIELDVTLSEIGG